MLITRQKVLRKFWYVTVRAADLRDGPRPFTLLGEKLVIFLDGDGRPAALADRCRHRTAMLSRGFCKDGHIVCGYHGWTYNRDGHLVKIPHFPDKPIPADSNVAAYRCESRYGYIWVALEEPLAPLPDFEEAADPSFRQIDELWENWKICSFRLMENSFDMAHIPFTHRGTFGNVAEPQLDLMKITPLEHGLETIVELPVLNREAATRAATGIDEEVTYRVMTGRWYMPFVRRLGISYPTGLRHSVITSATPISDSESLVTQWAYRNDTEEAVPAKDIIAFDRNVTEEDRNILESTDYDVCIDTRRRVELHMETDEPGLLMRRRLMALFREHGEEEVHG